MLPYASQWLVPECLLVASGDRLSSLVCSRIVIPDEKRAEGRCVITWRGDVLLYGGVMCYYTLCDSKHQV